MAAGRMALHSTWSSQVLCRAPLGVAPLLLFGYPRSPLAQPLNVVLGNTARCQLRRRVLSNRRRTALGQFTDPRAQLLLLDVRHRHWTPLNRAALAHQTVGTA